MIEIEKAYPCGIILLKTPFFKDKRGNLTKSYSFENFKKIGLDFIPKEHFFSFSNKNVLRGMHFQVNKSAHNKLVSCIKGSVLDVCVDVRGNSKFFNQPIAVKLDENLHNALYIPKGFAHGFISLEQNTLLQYMTSTSHSPSNDKGVLWSSIKFEWPIQKPIISDRDSLHPPIGDKEWKFF